MTEGETTIPFRPEPTLQDQLDDARETLKRLQEATGIPYLTAAALARVTRLEQQLNSDAHTQTPPTAIPQANERRVPVVVQVPRSK